MKKSPTDINWAVPTEEDLSYLNSLSREERTKLLLEHLTISRKSPSSEMTHEEIWQEALRQFKTAA